MSENYKLSVLSEPKVGNFIKKNYNVHRQVI